MLCNSKYTSDAEAFIEKALHAWRIESENKQAFSDDHERCAEEVFLLYKEVRQFDDSYYDIHPPIAMIIAGMLKAHGLEAAIVRYADIKCRLYTRLH
jgi:sulfur relay (sulfurtransferase) DsrC/TusE family protein